MFTGVDPVTSVGIATSPDCACCGTLCALAPAADRAVMARMASTTDVILLWCMRPPSYFRCFFAHLNKVERVWKDLPALRLRTKSRGSKLLVAIGYRQTTT